MQTSSDDDETMQRLAENLWWLREQLCQSSTHDALLVLRTSNTR